MGFPAIGQIRSFEDVKKAFDRLRNYFGSGEAGNVVAPTRPVDNRSLAAFDGTTGKRLAGLNDPNIKIEGVVTLPEIFASEHRYLVISISGQRIYALLGTLIPFIDSWSPKYTDMHLRRLSLSPAIVSGSYFDFVPSSLIYPDSWLPKYPDMHPRDKRKDLPPESFFYVGNP